MNRIQEIFAWIGRIGVMLAIWGVIAAFIYFIIMPLVVRKGREVEVPDYRNILIEEAIAKSNKQGFEIVVDDERFDAEAPTGLILDQHPFPQSLSKKGRRIHVAVSAGPPTSTVPDVVGKPRDDALFALERARVPVGEIRYSFSSNVYEGLVLEQTPLAEEEVPRDSLSSITVSLGKKPSEFIMPDVMGLPEEQARYLILKAGLQIGSVSYDKYVRHKDGTVVIQKPGAGEKLEHGFMTDLVVNMKSN